ncbi:MAG: EscU/YscU/HrcU family type III secretion system export apparatus switch protein [Candidatus Omnitrophica bacterium]|nr:EscU/YscU/HrcU family type III secretion system export apparatus switch protein [Candidatus Omnitrophota bacterium]
MPQENEQGQERTEQPTSRRRHKSREKGSVARSKEINSAVMLFFALCVFALYGPYLIAEIRDFIRYTFLHFHEIDITPSTIHVFAAQRLWFFFKLIIPIFFVFAIVGIVSNLAQFGWLFTTQTLFQGMKNFSLNPAKLVQKAFSVNNLLITGINIMKLVILASVAYHTLKYEIVKFPSLVQIPLTDALHYMSVMIFRLSLKIIVLLLILSAVDFIREKYKHEKSLKMTKQEIKDEMKMVEGNPQIKAQIRSAQRKMVISTMIKNVPQADVVITNPFHIAVAIRYDSANMGAPTLIAKGARLIAERVKEAARWASIPIIENKPLAQTIYKTINVGEEIPPKLYQAVAEILAYVYQLNKERGRQFAHI